LVGSVEAIQKKGVEELIDELEKHRFGFLFLGKAGAKIANLAVSPWPSLFDRESILSKKKEKGKKKESHL
jgi:hypothetical protein